MYASSAPSSSRPGSGAGTGPGTAGRDGCSRSPDSRGRVGPLDDLTTARSPGPATLHVLRLCFASHGRFLVLGITAVRRRDIAAHRAWMIRAYAIGLAAGSQVFTEGIGGALLGSGVVRDDLAKGAAG